MIRQQIPIIDTDNHPKTRKNAFMGAKFFLAPCFFAIYITISWEQRKLGSLIEEKRDRTTTENEDTLLSCAIEGMFLNSELFSHFRGSTNIGYLKVKKYDLILSAQNLHLGNCNVNLRFENGIISPAYKTYELISCNPFFIQAWVKQDSTKDFFLRATTEGASACRKNVVWEELYKQTLNVPNIDEQAKIGEYFDNLDTLITLHQREPPKEEFINERGKTGYAVSRVLLAVAGYLQRGFGEISDYAEVPSD